jgi:hypothetical protein
LSALLSLFEAALQGGDFLFVELADSVGQPAEQGDAHFVHGKVAGGDGIAEAKIVEYGGGVAPGFGIVEVELLQEFEVAGALLTQVAGVLKFGLQAMEFVAVGLIVVAGFVEGFADGPGLEALGAAEPPETSGDAFDEGVFDDILGFVVVEEALEEGAEILGAFGIVFGDDDVGGEEAMLDGVFGGSGLAIGRLRAGGFPGVLLVGAAFFG